jgi:rhamnosyltransferase
LGDPEIAASYGRQIPKEDANPIERFGRSFNYPSKGLVKSIENSPPLGVKTFFFSNCFPAIKKEAFKEVSGFPEKTIMNEDMCLVAKFLQKGYRIAYQADAAVYHSHNYSLAMQFKRHFDIGVFFNRNRWMRDLARSDKEGVKYLKKWLDF